MPLNAPAAGARPTLPVRLRPLTRDDFGLLSSWLAQPVVARWWAHDPSPTAVEADFGDAVDGREPGWTWIGEVEGRPFGLIQDYAIDSYPEYVEEFIEAGIELPAGAWSIDYLIGDQGMVGRGYGTALIAADVASIWQREPGASCLIVPVHADNAASVGALRSAGFRLLGAADMAPDNPVDDRRHLVSRLDRPPDYQD